MKKRVLLVGCLGLLLMSVVAVSCEKDKEEAWKGCACRVIWNDGDEERESLSPTEVKEFGADNCDRLVTILKRDADSDISSIYCTDL